MGFSPAGGLLMNNRPGDLDPVAIIYLMKEIKLSARKREGCDPLSFDFDFQIILSSAKRNDPANFSK